MEATWRDRLESDGYAELAGVFDAAAVDAMADELGAALVSAAAGESAIRSESGVVYAARNVLALWPRAADVWRVPPLLDALTSVLGPGLGLVRALFFDKPPEQTWALPWHKDLTIAVRDNRLPSAHFCKPTRKGGVPHVEAPREVLQAMLTARLHLDSVTDENGPLKVIPGSHNSGTTLAPPTVAPTVLHAGPRRRTADAAAIGPLQRQVVPGHHPAPTRPAPGVRGLAGASRRLRLARLRSRPHRFLNREGVDERATEGRLMAPVCDKPIHSGADDMATTAVFRSKRLRLATLLLLALFVPADARVSGRIYSNKIGRNLSSTGPSSGKDAVGDDSADRSRSPVSGPTDCGAPDSAGGGHVGRQRGGHGRPRLGRAALRLPDGRPALGPLPAAPGPDPRLSLAARQVRPDDRHRPEQR